MAKIQKSNAMRILERLKIPYEAMTYPHEEHVAVAGGTVAALTGKDPKAVYKTLVSKSDKGEPLVFVVPVEGELDLKLAASAAGVKSVAMLPLKDLLGLTGYERGGCSPVGMKKQFRTFIDHSAEPLPYMLVSGGRIGLQIEVNPHDLARAASASFAPIART